MLFLILFVGCLFLIYRLINNRYQTFNGRGIPIDDPNFFLGSFWRTVIRRMHFAEDMERLYHDLGDDRSRFVGCFNFISPFLMIKDPEVIKQIAIKEFDNFNDRPFTVPETVEPIFGRSLLSLKGEKWRSMRAALSPAFTSAKIRDMCVFMSDCGQQMIDFMESACKENVQKEGTLSIELEAKDLSSRFMTDVIATSVFGVTLDSFKTVDNVFLETGQSVTNFNVKMIAKTMFGVTFPRVAKFLGLRLSNDTINHYIKDLVINSMKYRQENNIKRRDMIDLLIEAKKGSLKHNTQIADQDAGFATVEESHIGKKEVKQVWTDDDLVAQAVVFFLAGFDTVSTLACFVLHALAVNPEIQDKLRREVNESVHKHGLAVTYDVIKEMKYLDMVISEGLRLWPSLGGVDRMCLKDVNIGSTHKHGDTTYTVKKGDIVIFPVYALQRDPKYWQNPTKFDPERFSDENKHKITPFTYLPFGAGPRNCIGSRFALMEAKILLYYLLAKFKVEVCSRTCVPVVLEKGQVFMRATGGFWLKFVKT